MPTPDLRRIIIMLYRMTPEQQREQMEEIYNVRRASYQAAMVEMAQGVGCARVAGRVQPPRGALLVALRRQSEEDAASIAATWNSDVEREVYRLYAANPRGNRQYYYANVDRWAVERQVWKQHQISSMTVGMARNLAREDFTRNNVLVFLGATYYFDGPSPVCADCADLMAAGEVEQQVVDQNPTPLHVNCFHLWKTAQVGGAVVCEELWVG